MADRMVTSDEILAVFGRLRSLWKRLYDEYPSSEARDGVLEQLREDLEAVTATARLSEEARPFVELAVLVRMNAWRPEGTELPEEVEEVAEGVRSGLEMRLRTLRQMEAGDDILPDSGRELRQSAARDLVFFNKLEGLSRRKEDPSVPPRTDEDELEGLVQSFDPRRKIVREESRAPTAATEAVEFLVRLSAR